MKAFPNQLWFPLLLMLIGTLIAPRAVLAAEGSGDHWGIWLTIGRLFNLALVVSVIVWLTRKPLSEFLAARTRSLHDQLSEAQKARLEAEAKLDEIESRMGRLDQELKAMKAAAEKDAQDEYRRLIE